MNEKLIADYVPLANSIAYKRKKILPNYITIEELKSAAYMGLIDAARKFNPSKGSFYNYASIRIIGSIKDHLRTIVDYGKSIDNEDFYYENKSSFTNDFFEAISKKLDNYEFKIIKMYYIESRTMKEIGNNEGLTESRISQIISSCHDKLKKVLKGKDI